jgi:hypothetical protein
MITKFTITGADDSINVESLFELSQKFPFVEWGILLSARSMGGNRFPSKKWIDDLRIAKSLFKHDIALSGHLCGKWVTELLKGNLSAKRELGEPIWDMFKRIQINTHAILHEVEPSAFDQMALEQQEFIFQYDGMNNDLHLAAKDHQVKHSCLFDLSHGVGLLPSSWPNLLEDTSCGYAGGLSPENLREQIEKIEEKAGSKEVWIDMETHVRSDHDMLFDLEKVEKCLSIVAEHISKRAQL